MVADLLRKLAHKLRKCGAPEKKQKLEGLPNPGTAGGGGVPNPVGSNTNPPKAGRGGAPKMPAMWR